MIGELEIYLRNQLSAALPGKDIQYQMASSRRIKEIPDLSTISGYKESAVCILLYKDSDKICFPLIERVVYAGVHSGQIALPGGKRDESDINIEHTALRELNEEIGVDASELKVIGSLTQVYIPPSNFLVHPIVAISPTAPVFQHNPDEVQSVIPFSLDELLNEDIVKETYVEIQNGLKIKTPYFDVRGKILWGATAMILNELKHVLKTNSSFSQFQ